MLKVLLVTGKLAQEVVKRSLSEAKLDGIKIEVKVLEHPIAALMSIDYLKERLKKEKLDYDLVVIPGLIPGDASKIEEEIKIKVVKGTEDASDIPFLIDAIRRGVPLSPTEAADRVIKSQSEEEFMRIYNEIKEKAKVAFEVNGLKIPIRPPPFIVAVEINPKLTPKEVEEEVYRVSDFADIIVVGNEVGINDPELMKRKVRASLDSGKVIGVDSISPRELIEGVKEGASLVLNLTIDNIESLDVIKREAAFVIAPIEGGAEEVEKVLRRAEEMGYNRLMLDSILKPPLFGLVDSIIEFNKLRKLNYPLFIGILNVSELIDADSTGVNALLTNVAAELGASVLLTMDEGRSFGSSWEVKLSSMITSVAMYKGKTPKGLGKDLLILKERGGPKTLIKERAEEEVRVDEVIEPTMSKKGYLKIGVDKEIEVYYYPSGSIKPKKAFYGKDPLSLGRKIVKELSLEPEHSLYLGYELAKAKIALDLGKTYIQDKELFSELPWTKKVRRKAIST
jgi:dihydropteroate synthase-like protein